MFVVKARSFPWVEHLKDASLEQAPALLANISLVQNQPKMLNAIAFYAQKSFITLDSRFWKEKMHFRK